MVEIPELLAFVRQATSTPRGGFAARSGAMSEQLPLSTANGSADEPPLAESNEITFDALVGDAAANTDDAPTIISKAPPTQPFLHIPTPETPVSSSIRGRSL